MARPVCKPAREYSHGSGQFTRGYQNAPKRQNLAVLFQSYGKSLVCLFWISVDCQTAAAQARLAARFSICQPAAVEGGTSLCGSRQSGYCAFLLRDASSWRGVKSSKDRAVGGVRMRRASIPDRRLKRMFDVLVTNEGKVEKQVSGLPHSCPHCH